MPCVKTSILLSIVRTHDFKRKVPSRLCIVWKAENDIQTLDWPAWSPDVNPIENVWSIIKRKLQGKRHFKAVVSPCLSCLAVTATICGKPYRKYARRCQ